MSRQSRSRALAASRKKKKESKQTPYKTRSAWVGSGPTLKNKTLKKQYSTDGGKTWITGTPPGGTGSGGKKLSTSVRGEQKKATAEKENLKVNTTQKEEKKPSKKKTSKPNLVQTPSPTWGVKKTNTGENLSKKINNKDTPKETKKKKITARSRMEARNREIHGDDAIDALKQKNKDFQAAKKKKGGMAEFAKKYPNSQTAKRRKLKIATWRDVE